MLNNPKVMYALVAIGGAVTALLQAVPEASIWYSVLSGAVAVLGALGAYKAKSKAALEAPKK